jgi:hypothetical protein
MSIRTSRVVAALGMMVFTGSAWAMVYYDGSTDNTTAPTGEYADSGWDWVGAWGSGNGIVVSAKQFLTAKHFGASSTFVLNGVTYHRDTSIPLIDDSNSDLRLVTIQETFTSWAPLYENTNENGKEVVMFGRGKTRGAEVNVGGTLQGWQWSSTGLGTMRWGTNIVDYATTDYLIMGFDTGASINEAALAQWDSGGGMFIKDGGEWKLAGINYGAWGFFDLDVNHSSGNEFYASLFDCGGLYRKIDETNWQYIQHLSNDQPGYSYGTRISSRIGWIEENLVPEPATMGLLSAGGLLLLFRLRRHRA